MTERRLIEDRTEVMLGMYVEYVIDGCIKRGEIISFLQTSPELLYVVKWPAYPELALVRFDDVDVIEYR
nr:MAG TPA: hypothetical protein [Caudoviricetes sp.]